MSEPSGRGRRPHIPAFPQRPRLLCFAVTKLASLILAALAMPEGAIFMIGGKAYQEGTAYAAPAPPRNFPHSSLHGATLTRRATTPPAVNSTACASRAR